MFTRENMFQAILLSVVLVLVYAWLSIRLARYLRLIDQPGSAPHKKHTRPTPLAGGLALFGALLVAEWYFGTLSDPFIRATFIAGAIIFAFGLLDDFINLPPRAKLGGQLLATVVLIWLGVRIQIFESPQFFIHFPPPLPLYADWLVTAFWVVGITNAFNFVDSMDGLAVGLGGMAAGFFMLVTLDAGQPHLAQHSALIIGICIGLYLFNAPPAMLFLGDSGAQTLGFILAVLGIAYRPVGVNQSASWFVPILMVGVPIFDTALVVFSRLRRGRPVYTGACDHTYHRLLKLGLGPFRSVLLMQIVALGLGCFDFVVMRQRTRVANLGFAAVILLGVLAIGYLDQPKRGLIEEPQKTKRPAEPAADKVEQTPLA